MESGPKEEKVNFSNSNLTKLDVSRGENITELYVQGNQLEEIDLSHNDKIKILDCTDNPLICILGKAPCLSENGIRQGDLILRACKGGTVGLKYSPEEGQQYYAYASEGYKFDGWYDILSDRLSKEAVWKEAYGTCREIFAMFVKV